MTSRSLEFISRMIARTLSDPLPSSSPPFPPPIPAIPPHLPPPMSGRARDQEHLPPKKLEWDWNLEHQDRAKEAKADRAVHNAQVFLVDRRILRDVVKEKFQVEVARIVFISSGESLTDQRSISPLLCPPSLSQERSTR